MKRNALLTLVCCLVMGVAAIVATPSPAMAMPYHATDAELQGTAYAVLNATTGELDFVRSTETHANGDTGTVTSISGGTYTGTIYVVSETVSGNYGPGWHSVASSVKSVRFVDAVRPRTAYQWFYGMKNCTAMDLSKLDTSKATVMYFMFYNCSSLSSLDLSSFDTSQVTGMDNMFYNCSSLSSLDLSNFDTSKVTGMGWMFDDCRSLTSLDVSSFDTSKVTGMHSMFYGCSSLTSLDVSAFDTSQVTNMSSMFKYCRSLNKLTVSDKFVIN